MAEESELTTLKESKIKRMNSNEIEINMWDDVRQRSLKDQVYPLCKYLIVYARRLC